MATGRISKSKVDAAEPGVRDWMLWDDRLAGFGLKITPAGSRVFIYQYRLGGRGAKTRRFTIGKHGKLTAEAARKKAEALALSVANGIDPQRKKAEQVRLSIDLAFKPYVERFREGCLVRDWKSTHKYAASLLDGDFQYVGTICHFNYCRGDRLSLQRPLRFFADLVG